MRNRFAVPTATLALAVAGACATGGGRVETGPGATASRADLEKQERDSIIAQRIADQVGPRVRVRATMNHFAGSRQVEANFHMYDDAYVVVGHLDAGGRLRIVFPQAPGDDGFVRADKIYHVPSFFAGFGDEYRWRYAEYRYRYHSFASQRDSYDGGLGYVFVIASWRPMRLDRISDGAKWQTYEISDINYLSDPREAIEELASVLAGDNREAYTIEYASYLTTNYGAYSYSTFSNCYESLLGSGFYPSFGFGLFNWYSPFSAFGSGCGSRGYYGYSQYAYGRPIFYVPGGSPIVQPPAIRPPSGVPINRRPRFPGDLDIGGPQVTHRPQGQTATTAGQTDQTSAYRRRGLIAEDAPPNTRGRQNDQARRRLAIDENGQTRRPGLHEMIGGARIREATQAQRPRAPMGGFRGSDDAAPRSTTVQRASGSYRGGVSQPRADEGSGRTYSPARGSGGSESGWRRPASSSGGSGGFRGEPRSSGSSGSSGGAQSAPRASPPPAPARAEPSAPPRSEPASTDRRKPGQ